MARVKNEQDLLLRKRARRRLVGSVVLVIVAIIVLPMILERAPKQERTELEIIIPSEMLPDESSEEITLKDSVPGAEPASIKAVKESGAESNTSKEVVGLTNSSFEKRIGSFLRCGISTVTISLARRPFSCALVAFIWLQ